MWSSRQVTIAVGAMILVLTAWSALDKPKLLDRVVAPTRSPQPKLVNLDATSQTATFAMVGNLERAPIDQMTRDPFVETPVITIKSAPKPASPQLVVATLPVPPLTIAPPQPPALNLRFMGRMTAPDGVQSVYASLGDTPITLSVGQSLPNGYRVDAIKERVVEFSYLPLDTKAILDLPDTPKYEIR